MGGGTAAGGTAEGFLFYAAMRRKGYSAVPSAPARPFTRGDSEYQVRKNSRLTVWILPETLDFPPGTPESVVSQ